MQLNRIELDRMDLEVLIRALTARINDLYALDADDYIEEITVLNYLLIKFISVKGCVYSD